MVFPGMTQYCNVILSFPMYFMVGAGPLVPYGLPCIRELFRFLISLINPHDRWVYSIISSNDQLMWKICSVGLGITCFFLSLVYLQCQVSINVIVSKIRAY